MYLLTEQKWPKIAWKPITTYKVVHSPGYHPVFLTLFQCVPILIGGTYTETLRNIFRSRKEFSKDYEMYFGLHSYTNEDLSRSIARCYEDYDTRIDVATGQLMSFRVTNPENFSGGEITVIDDLCDGGGTFVGLAPKLRELNPTKLRLVVTHAVQLDGIERVAEVYDEVIISNTYINWDKAPLPGNVKVHLLDFS